MLVSRAVSRRPDFFILGAPKCGTTALSEYLRQHERIFVSTPKEPHYFCDDFDYYYAPGQRTEEHYLRLFDEAGDDAPRRRRGIGLVPLLSHRGAPHHGVRPRCARDRDGAQPGRAGALPPLAAALHARRGRARPGRAWELQAARARGEGLPATVRVPEFLQYGEAARLGAQVRRVLEHGARASR